MSALKAIRGLLRVTQAELGEALGVTQGNVSFYERGQTIPPDIAGRVLDFARSRGLHITYDHLYGGAALPESAGGRQMACGQIPRHGPVGNLPALQEDDFPLVQQRTERGSVQVLQAPRTAPGSGGGQGPEASEQEAAHA